MTYHLKLQGLVGEDDVERLRAGLALGGAARSSRCRVDRLAATEKNTWVEMVVPEARPRALKAAGEA